MIKKISLLVVVLVVTGVSFYLRFLAVDKLPIDYDEDDYLGAAIHYAQAIRERNLAEIVNYDYNYEHPPLTKLAYGLAILPLAPAEPVAEQPASAPIVSSLPEPHFQVARTLSAIFGGLAVLALAILDPLAGFFLAISTWQIKYTSQIMLEPLPALTSLLAVFFYLKSGRRWNIWLFLSAASFGLTAASKYPYAVVGIAIVVHWLWEQQPEGWQRDRSLLLRWLAPPFLWGVMAITIFFIANPRLWSDPFNRLWSTLSFHGTYAQSDWVQQAGFPPWQPLVWLFQSVPWHPGVFLLSVDVFITLLALLGFRRLWEKQRVFALWLVIALGFLLVWPTKWPQYILILTAPLSISAAQGFRIVVWVPLLRIRESVKASSEAAHKDTFRERARGLKRALPWLLPGLVVLGLIAVYPMLFQGAMSLTDFSSTAIRDGLNGGVWREAWLGITGQVQAVVPRIFQRSLIKEVSYAGPSLLVQLIGGAAADLVVFGLLWTVLTVATQTGLGVVAALMLNRAGVRFKGWWQAVYILPWAIPEFVAALMWAQIFDPRFGWFNQAAKTWYERADYPGAVNLVTQWQENPSYALLVLLITATWYGFPFMMLAASAGLKLVPTEIYDSAAIDGAGGLRLFRHITWPLLLPLLVPAIIIRAIFSFNQFYLFLVLQPPSPLATFSITSFFFFDQLGQYGVSAALNIFTVLVLVALILWFNRLSQAAEGYTYA
jgi:ABC-type sugar transport system permease subunit